MPWPSPLDPTRSAAHPCVAVILALVVSAGPAAGQRVHPSAALGDPVAPHLLPSASAAPRAAPLRSLATKRLYIANDDHTDYMWAADEAGYRAALPNMLDLYMTQAETTATYPADCRGRFNADGTLWVWIYEHERSPAEVQRLWSHIRDGTITVPLNTCVQLWGAMPTEAALRSLYYAGQLERRENVSFPLVVPMEDQTLPGGVASLWAGSGARWAWKGICNCVTRIDATQRADEIYRFTGPDGQSVVMKWNTQTGGNQSIGGYAEARDPYAAVDYMDSDPGFLARWPYDVAGAFGYGWDDAQTYTSKFLEASRDLSDATRRVIVSNETDFFQDFEATYGPSLPSYGGSFGNEWDLGTASMGATTSGVKRAVERLRTAEALASLVALNDSTMLRGLTSARDSMNIACGLFYEHNWNTGPGVTAEQRADWEHRIAAALTGYVDLLEDRALKGLGALVAAPAGVERHVVFNPLSWPRTDVVDLATDTPAPARVVDVATGQEMPSQFVTVDGQPRLRFLARNVASVGYRVFEVQPVAPAAFPPAATVNGATLDNGLYAVTLGARGQLTSVVDHKDADRELVQAGRSLLDLGDGAGTVELESSGPVSATLSVASGGAPGHRTRVTLYAGLDRIDYDGLVYENFSDPVSYVSDFAYAAPVTHHEEVGMIATAARQSQGGDYADVDTRTDWLTLNHFVDIGESTRGAVLSAMDSPYFELGSSTPTTLDAGSARIAAVVGMRVDGNGFGIPAQGGDSSFPGRFALRTRGAYDPALAMRFALEHQNPLVATRVTGGPDAPLSGKALSLLTVSSPDVVLWSLKPAEEGITHGLIARLWNVADGSRSAALNMQRYGIGAAMRCTHVETDLYPVPTVGDAIVGDFARQQLVTWRLVPDTVLGVPGPRAGSGLDLLAFPNPARSSLPGHLAFDLPAAGHVRITLHDLRGARIATLADHDATAGRNRVDWSPGALSPGVYFVRLEYGGRIATRRVAVLD